MLLTQRFITSVTRQSHCRTSYSNPPRAHFTTGVDYKRTALINLHREKLEGDMVDFEGWEMPMRYKADTIVESHLHTRKHASLFDVSHMTQLRWTGRDRLKFLESVTVADLGTVAEGHAKLTLITNEKGGIKDDTVITNRGDHFYMVVNAGCAEKDLLHLNKQLRKFNGDVKLETLDRSLVALQGPSAEAVLSTLVNEDLTTMPFMTSRDLLVDGVPCLVSRCGYTGEDGFEISVPNEKVLELAEKFLSNSEVKPAGLGARDTLRLEAGLCLYGHDLNEQITPVEAALTWCIGKRRREEGGFLGAQKILEQLNDPSLLTRKRVGFIVAGPPAREHTKIFAEGQQVGEVTSGTMSPVLNKAISMGYIHPNFAKVGTEVEMQVRNKMHKATVTKMPFVPPNYKKIQ